MNRSSYQGGENVKSADRSSDLISAYKPAPLPFVKAYLTRMSSSNLNVIRVTRFVSGSILTLWRSHNDHID